MTLLHKTDPFQFLGPNWRSTPYSLPLFHNILELVSKDNLESHPNLEIVGRLAGGFGLDVASVLTCLRALK